MLLPKHTNPDIADATQAKNASPVIALLLVSANAAFLSIKSEPKVGNDGNAGFVVALFSETAVQVEMLFVTMRRILLSKQFVPKGLLSERLLFVVWQSRTITTFTLKACKRVFRQASMC